MSKQYTNYEELSKKEKDKIVSEFYSGVKMNEIYEKYNIYSYIFNKIREEYGLKHRAKRYSEKEVNSAIKDFQNGMNYAQITKKYGMSDTFLSEQLKNRRISHYTNQGRKNNFNLNYFENIDSPDKAYFLGFLYGDGSLTKSNTYDTSPNRIQLNLSKKDSEVIYNFCDFLGYDKKKIEIYSPRGTYSSSQMIRLSLNSKKMCNDLLKIDFREKVEFSNGDIFEHITKKLWSHFIRGLNDADGSTSQKLFSVTNQLPLLNSFIEIIESEIGIPKDVASLYSYKDRGHKNTRDLRYTRNTSVEIFKFLYKNSTPEIRLKRKYDSIKHLLI